MNAALLILLNKSLNLCSPRIEIEILVHPFSIELLYYIYLFTKQHICHDSLQTSTTVWVYIIDENDNAPAFAAKEYVTILTEGPETVGATIATVTASDPDEGLNGTLRYAITLGNVAQTFNISPTTVDKTDGS